jgi:hypothetical protein
MKRLIKISTTVLFALFILVGSALTCGHGGNQGSDSDNGSPSSPGTTGTSGNPSGSTSGDSGSNSSGSTSGNSSSQGTTGTTGNIGIASPSTSSIGNSNSNDANTPWLEPQMTLIKLDKKDCWIVTNGWCVNVISPGIWRAESLKTGRVVIYHKVKK